MNLPQKLALLFVIRPRRFVLFRGKVGNFVRLPENADLSIRIYSSGVLDQIQFAAGKTGGQQSEGQIKLRVLCGKQRQK